MAAAGPGGSADKASKVKSLLASYYDLDDGDGEPSPSLYDTPRWVWWVLPHRLPCCACPSLRQVNCALCACLIMQTLCQSDSASLPTIPRSTAPSPGAVQRSLAPSLGGASAAADVAALNASYFDPDAYLKRVLKETRLADLAALQRDMLGEVGGLDSDMQVRGGKNGRARHAGAGCWGSGAQCITLLN